jgi:hypothetical protein
MRTPLPRSTPPYRTASILVLLGLVGCPYTYTANDAGNGAWVEQVVPAVLGRKPINALESQVLVYIADQEGRGAVLDVLMSLPEFDAYWSLVLADAMKVQRSGVLQQTSTCWNNYSMYPSAGVANATLADGLSTQVSATSAPAGVTSTFSNADTLRSAIAADDLFAPYRAQLISLGFVGAVWSGPARDVFLSAYTNRTPLCIQCHTSTSSSSEISSIPLDIDGNLFPGGYWAADNVHFGFAEDGFATGTAFGFMHTNCGRIDTTAEVDPGLGSGTAFAGISLTQFACTDGAGNDCESYDILDLDAAMMDGMGLLPTSDLGTGLTTTQAEDYSFSHPAVGGTEGFALALALTVTEAVVKEVEGHGLTLPHGQPRVDEQRSYLQGYTSQLVASDWSLRTVLKTLVHAGTFNMRPPSQSPSIYPFPMFFTGWAADPAADDTFDNVNGQGDLAHRYSIPTLFRSVHHALGWAAPKVFATSAYPSHDLQRTLGRYESYEETGFDAVTYQSLLAWEVGVGTCQAPTSAADWIDRVMMVVNADSADSVYDYSLQDVIVALKDRLIQEPDVDDGMLEAAPDDVELADLGVGDDGGIDWESDDEVGLWAKQEAARAEERATQRTRARAVTAVFETRMETLDARAPRDTSARADDAWLDEFDFFADALGDATWTRTWGTARDTVTEGTAAALLDDYGVTTRLWGLPHLSSEANKLADYFGTSMGYPAVLVPDLEDKLRGYCGTLLTTPQFMLGGMRRYQPAADPVPELLVCLPAQADYCDEGSLCTLYNGYLTAHGHGTLACPP